MKGVCILVLAFVLVSFATKSYATTHYVEITDVAFTPDSFTANVGDTVIWTFSDSNVYQSNTTSDTVPFGAPNWNSGPEEGGGPNFMYVITIPGSYHYQSGTYYDYFASFTVAPVTHVVLISDYTFTPDSFTASVGDTVIWLAQPGNAYNNNTVSTAVGPYATGWSSGVLAAGQSYTYVITAPGIYDYKSNATNTFTGNFNVIGNFTHYVIITDTAFVPNYFTANVGDTVVWVVTSLGVDQNTMSDTAINSIPYYANLWNSGPMLKGDSFTYAIYPNTEGLYNYGSDSINTFYGTFLVGSGVGFPTGISVVASKPAATLIFQNPFSDRLDISSGQPGQVTIYDILGNKVAYTPLEFSNHPVEVNMAGFSSGVYLIAFSSGGVLLRTYKAVKVE